MSFNLRLSRTFGFGPKTEAAGRPGATRRRSRLLAAAGWTRWTGRRRPWRTRAVAAVAVVAAVVAAAVALAVAGGAVAEAVAAALAADAVPTPDASTTCRLGSQVLNLFNEVPYAIAGKQSVQYSVWQGHVRWPAASAAAGNRGAAHYAYGELQLLTSIAIRKMGRG